jgi:hypothetical protein
MLGDADHPLPRDLWQGTPRKLVASLLPQLAPTTSPILQSLSRRLLLSDGVAPQGPDAPGGPSVAMLRIDRLRALGEIGGALAVIGVLPASMRGDNLDRERIELDFAKNDSAGGCRDVQDSIARHQGVWWDRALIACQALAGDQEKAGLGLGLLREQKAAPDPIFDSLIDALRGHPTKLDKLPDPSPIRVALVAAAKLPLPADAVASADPATLRAWAGNEAIPPLLRLAAAERAAAFGTLTPKTLAELYAKVEFKPEEIGAAIKHGKPPETARDRALLFAVVRTDPAVLVRAKALTAVLGDARKRADLALAAALVTPWLADLAPGSDLASLAPDAARAFYTAGQPEPAAAWLAVADADTAPMLALVARIAQGDAGPAQDVAALKGTLADLAVRDPAKATIALTLLTAFDDPVAQDILVSNSVPGKSANPTLMLSLQQASAAKRVGETVLVTLLVARSDDHLTTDPLALGQAVGALRAIGLERDARRLALEAALDAGI